MRRLLFHLAVVTHHLFCAYFFTTIDFKTVTNDTILKMNAVRGSFLTGWNFSIQAAYFVISVAEDLVRLNNLHKLPSSPLTNKTLQNLKHALFTIVVFPLSCFVSMIFWVFFTYNRELVYPAALDEALPLWFNHSLHTSIIVAAILEMFLVFHPYTKRKWGIACLVMLSAAYGVCVILTHFWHDVWVYPMLALMTWPQRISFFTLSGCIVCVLYEMGHRLSTVIWGDKARQHRVSGTTHEKSS